MSSAKVEKLLQEAISLMGLVQSGNPVSSRWIKARNNFVIEAGTALASEGNLASTTEERYELAAVAATSTV